MALKEYNPSEVRIFFGGKELGAELHMAALDGPGSDSSKALAFRERIRRAVR